MSVRECTLKIIMQGRNYIIKLNPQILLTNLTHVLFPASTVSLGWAGKMGSFLPEPSLPLSLCLSLPVWQSVHKPTASPAST